MIVAAVDGKGGGDVAKSEVQEGDVLTVTETGDQLGVLFRHRLKGEDAAEVHVRNRLNGLTLMRPNVKKNPHP